MKFSAYLYINRGNYYGLPYREAIESVLWCDEIFIGTDPRFDDGTLAQLKELQTQYSNLHIVAAEFDYNQPNPHGAIKQQLRDMCDGDWLVELDADEYLLQNSIDGLKDLCENAHPPVYAIEVPMLHFFNGNWLHQEMPPFRTLMSRNIKQIRHDIGEVNYNGRYGAALITNKELKVNAGLRYPQMTVYHYGWYSLPRKWEMKQTLHYYLGKQEGKYNSLDDYTKNLDNEGVNFWDLPWTLPIEHYIGAIHTEMHTEPLKRFRGKHPAIMSKWLAEQRVLPWRENIPSKLKNWLSFG